MLGGQAAAAGSPVDNLGEPVHKTLSTYQAIGADQNGNPQAYFVSQGNYSDENAEFSVVDLRTQKTVFDTRVPDGYAGEPVYSPVDGNVYIAMSDVSGFYRYTPGAAQLQSIDISAIADQRIWSMAVGPDGTVWMGTYPSGDIISYVPATGALHNYGQMLPNQTYITALQPTADGVYFGTQPDTELGFLDTSTGTATQIPLPSDYQGQAGKIGMLALRGSRLFVEIAAVFNGALVYDVTSKQWVATISDFSGSAVSDPDPSDPNAVYFRIAAGNIVRFHLDTLTRDVLSWAPNAFPGAFDWVDLASSDYPGKTLMFTYYTSCRIYGYNFTSNKSYYLQPNVQGSGDQLIALGEGPDGNVYAGAYLTPPGMGQWDPDKGAWTLLTGSGQVEGYGSYKGNLVFGRYPQGALYYYDLSQPWNGSTNPKAPVDIGNEQNRPVTFVDMGDQVAVGSVPESGRLGGAITLWQPETGALQVYRNVVQDQTPVSMVLDHGLLWGGTSIDGGYGIDPSTTSATLFAWDPATHKTVYQSNPFPKATNISGLVLDRYGNLWGIADSTLFEFNVQQHRVVFKKTLYSTVDGSFYGLEHQLVFAHGRLYGTTDGRLFEVIGHSARTLFTGSATNLTKDRHDNLYFVNNSSYVYRYRLG
jgi:hypothetical protein